MSLFRPTALKYIRNLGVLVALCFGLLALWSASAMAKPHFAKEAPASKGPAAKAPVEPAICPGQTFSQSLLAFGDSNYYTLVEGSEFSGGAGSWELRNGAEVVAGTRPDGSSGNVLDLPSGAIAVSPPVCVTMQYPTARTWVQSAEGGGGVTVGVFYAGTKPTGKSVGHLESDDEGGWTLSDPFDIRPELTGKEEGVREVRFVFANTTRDSDFNIWGLFVDPRMR